MFTTGDRTMRMPRLRVSRAMAAATRPTSAESHVAASAIPAGYTVAPRRITPCTASSKFSIGMPSRVRSRR